MPSASLSKQKSRQSAALIGRGTLSSERAELTNATLVLTLEGGPSESSEDPPRREGPPRVLRGSSEGP